MFAVEDKNNRLLIPTTHEGRGNLRAAWPDVQGRFPFTIVAVCLLPDPLHCIWGYPMRWKEIKRMFTRY
jgi:REP element-mobilizing transposase RayT